MSCGPPASGRRGQASCCCPEKGPAAERAEVDKEHGSEEHYPENLQEGAAGEGQEDPSEELREHPEREQAEVDPKHSPGQGRDKPATGGRRHPVPRKVKTVPRPGTVFRRLNHRPNRKQTNS